MFFLTGTNMNKKTFDFTIIGGDMRQVALQNYLALKGYCICHYGLCEPLKAALHPAFGFSFRSSLLFFCLYCTNSVFQTSQ